MSALNHPYTANVIKVDEDIDVIFVYDMDGVAEPRTFLITNRAATRLRAEKYAAAEAKRLGIDWCANY